MLALCSFGSHKQVDRSSEELHKQFGLVKLSYQRHSDQNFRYHRSYSESHKSVSEEDCSFNYSWLEGSSKTSSVRHMN